MTWDRPDEAHICLPCLEDNTIPAEQGGSKEILDSAKAKCHGQDHDLAIPEVLVSGTGCPWGIAAAVVRVSGTSGSVRPSTLVRERVGCFAAAIFVVFGRHFQSITGVAGVL